MATHSSILAWRISWTEEPGGLQSMGSQRVGHDWATNTYLLTYDKRFTPNFTQGTGENIFHIKMTHSQAYFVGTSADSQVTQEGFRKWAYPLWGYCVVYRKIQISIYTGIWQVGQKSRHVVINSKLLSGAAVEYFQMWGDHTVAITLHLNFRAILLSKHTWRLLWNCDDILSISLSDLDWLKTWRSFKH